MTSSETYPIVIRADQEHSALQGAVLLLLLAAMIIVYFLLRALVTAVSPDSGFNGLFTCIAAFPLSLLLVWPVEQGLKKMWPSGRTVSLDQQGVTASFSGDSQVGIQWSEPITPLYWSFPLSGYKRGGRERRVPKGWHCLSSELRYGEKQITVFTYMPPKKGAALREAGGDEQPFRQLDPEELHPGGIRGKMGPPSRPEITSKVIAGKDGRWWLAERRRWSDGLELTPSDFQLFISEVRGHL